MQPSNEPTDQLQSQQQPIGDYPQQPMQPPSTGNGQSPRRKGAVMSIVVGLCLIVAGAAIILWGRPNNDENANVASDESSQEESSTTKDLSDVEDISFVAPDMSTYQVVDVTDTFSSYLTVSGQSSADTCRLNFGIVDAQELPGADVDAILRPQMDSLVEAGARIDGPKKTDPLVLQSPDGGQSYRLPTYEVTVNKDAAHGTNLYSIAILGNGKRALVSRSCSSTTGPLDPTSLQKLQATAERLKITVK